MSRSTPVRVVHLITGLDPGGAERFLARLLTATDPRRVRHRVFALKAIPAESAPAGVLLDAGIEVESLDLALDVGALRQGSRRAWALHRWVRRGGADVLQGWLHHGDFFAWLVGQGTQVPVVWNLRQSEFAPEHKVATRTLARALAELSAEGPSAIVACAQSASRAHVELGYAEAKIEVIENGFDAHRFRALSAADRRQVRSELGLDDDRLWVAFVGRNDPAKDLGTFLDATDQVLRACDRAGRVLIGAELDAAEGPRTRMLGRREDLHRVLPAVDVVVSTSKAMEGLSNTLAQASLAGVPIVATDVGDARRLVVDDQQLTPKCSPAATAKAVLRLLENDHLRRQLGEQGRAHVAKRFGLERSVERYTDLWERVAAGAACSSG